MSSPGRAGTRRDSHPHRAASSCRVLETPSSCWAIPMNLGLGHYEAQKAMDYVALPIVPGHDHWNFQVAGH